MKKNTSMRSSNIELLRILCCFFVLIEHFCEVDGFGGFDLVGNNKLNFVCMNALYSLSRSAVNIFIIISGYFMINNNKRKFGKILSLFFITILCSELSYILFTLIRHEEISIGHIAFLLLPRSYFIYIYIALYAISPFVNIVLMSLDKKQYLNFLIWMILLFSIWSTFINFVLPLFNAEGLSDVYTVTQTDSGRGFSIVGFVLMYCLGGYVKRFKVEISTKKIVVCLLGCISIITVVSVFIPKSSVAILNYDSILVIIESLCIFIMAERIKLQKKVINFVAQSVIWVYLLHRNFEKAIMNLINAKILCSQGLISMLLCIIMTIIFTYVFCFIIHRLIIFLGQYIQNRFTKSKLYNWDMNFLIIMKKRIKV